MLRFPVLTSLHDKLMQKSKHLFSPDSKKPSFLSVIITTYNHPAWLQKTFWGYFEQKYDQTPVEIIIADDGSKDETRQLIDSNRSESPWPIKHVWQPDEGFQKCRILNKAILASVGDYLIFSDHDCIPRNDLLSAHFSLAEHGFFLSGGYTKLPLTLSEQITRSDIIEGRAFQKRWLKLNGFRSKGSVIKLVNNYRLARLWNELTPTPASWNGCMSSCWKSDAIAVNGFNEELQYGGEDREFGERLVNFGVKGKQARYSLTALHLEHGRPYVHAEAIKKVNETRHKTRTMKIVTTPHGIIKQHMSEENTADQTV